jgi:hypothetical protein
MAAQAACQKAQTPARTLEHHLHRKPAMSLVHNDDGSLVH